MTWSYKSGLLQQPADVGERRWSIVHVNPSFLESAVPATFTGLFPAERYNKLIKVFYHNGPHSQILSRQNSLMNLQDECAAAAATHYNLITKWGKKNTVRSIQVQNRNSPASRSAIFTLHIEQFQNHLNHLYIASYLRCFNLIYFNLCSSKNHPLHFF